MFGLSVISQYDGDYSGIAHAGTNISEAGSLVRRRVFAAGVQFDESMRQGFEDWDFWLGAREQGFRGRHIKNLGFEYRKRPESMLADSHRDEAEIKAYMQRKRRSLFRPQNLLALEAEEAPRYAFVIDGSSVYLALDPRSKGERITFEEFIQRFWRWILQPARYHFPPFVIWTSQKTFDAADEAGVLGWCCWDLEARTRHANFAATSLTGGRELGIGTPNFTDLNVQMSVNLILLSSEFLREICKDPNGLKWFVEVMTNSTQVRGSERTVTLPGKYVGASSKLRVPSDVLSTVMHLSESEYADCIETDWNWPLTGQQDRHTAYLTVRAAANQGVVMPFKPDGRRHIGIFVSFADFGGVEKVAFNVAKTLRDAGYVPHLVLFRTGNVSIPPAMRDIFESYSWVTSDNLLRWDGDKFYGTDLSWWSQNGDRTDVIGLLSWFDAVLNCQSADAHGVMGELRRRGVLTLTHQHIVEMSPAGRPGGSAMIAKAFEHSYAAMLTGSRRLYSWFIANGVPQEKLFNVDNAPSYELSAEFLERVALDRKARAHRDGPLRILFAARMDVQKGLDRVLRLLELTHSMDVQWRIVGKPIVGADPLFTQLNTFLKSEPPVYSEEELTALYCWADVVVLPSRFEGVPLTAIEAMRCGAVMLVADAGGVDEIIDSSVDGIIVPQETCVEDMLTAIKQLGSDRGEVLRISLRAMERAAGRTWVDSLSQLLKFLMGRLPVSASSEPSLEAQR